MRRALMFILLITALLTSSVSAYDVDLSCEGPIPSPDYGCLFTGRDYLKQVRTDPDNPYSSQILRSEDGENWEVVLEYVHGGTASLNNRHPIFGMIPFSSGSKIGVSNSIIYANDHYVFWTGGGSGAIYLFDSDFNFLQSNTGPYAVEQLSLVDGTLYAKGFAPVNFSEGNGKLYRLTDLKKWEVIGENQSVPYKAVGNILQQFYSADRCDLQKFQITSDKFGERTEVAQEIEKTLRIAIGDYFYAANGNRLSYSKDGVYWATITIPEDAGNIFTESVNSIRQLDDKLYIRCSNEYYSYNLSDLETMAPQRDIYIKINNEILGFDTPPVMESDRMLVPMRFLFEQMGANVDWNNDTQTATVRESGKEIAFSIDSTDAKVGGKTKTMDVPARLINDKTMVPLRFLSEGLGYRVEWDEKHNIASISKQEDVTAMRFGNGKTSDKFWF